MKSGRRFYGANEVNYTTGSIRRSEAGLELLESINIARSQKKSDLIFTKIRD